MQFLRFVYSIHGFIVRKTIVEWDLTEPPLTIDALALSS